MEVDFKDPSKVADVLLRRSSGVVDGEAEVNRVWGRRMIISDLLQLSLRKFAFIHD